MIKIGVQSSSWFDEKDPQTSLRFYKECGFDAIDYNIDAHLRPGVLAKQETEEYTSLFDKTVEELFVYYTPLKEAIAETGVTVSQMHAPFYVWMPGKDKLNDYVMMAIKKCVAVCHFLGCPALVVHPTLRDREWDEYEFNLNIYRQLIPDAQKYGVKICLENIFSRHGSRMIEGRLSDAAVAARMIDALNQEAGMDAFGFCFDIGHAILTRKNIRAFIRTLGHRLTILHIHDNDGNEDLHMIPCTYLQNGSTHIADWDGLVEGLRDIGYRGTLAFEVFRIYTAFPKSVHKEALRLVSAIGREWAKRLEE